MEIYLIVITVIFSAFFSGMEIAFLSSNKLKIALESKKGILSSVILHKFVLNPRHFIATMLIGNNIALVFYGIFMATLLEPLLQTFTQSEFNILLIQTLISTTVILFLGEFFPKVLFKSNPNYLFSIFAIPVYVVYYILLPVSSFFIAFSKLAIKLLGQKNNDEKTDMVFGRIDLDNYLEIFLLNSTENTHTKSKADEIKMFQNALDFTHVKIRECIIPRTEIEAIELNDNIDNLKELFIQTGYSKIIVYRDKIDDIIGYVHSKDLFKNPKQIKNILHEVIIVPETMPANKLLALFIKEKKNVSVVVDEFGGTSGIVTIEDILEEILGEINDEHDTDSLEEKKISEHEFILSGRQEIDYLNEKFNLNIPESDEYETIAGYILTAYKNIPKVNEIIDIDNFTIKVIKSSSTKIELINIKIKEA